MGVAISWGAGYHGYCCYSDGVSRTGTFCALYSVLERVKTEQIVDVFQAVKTLRIQRAGLLGTFVSTCGCGMRGWV